MKKDQKFLNQLEELLKDISKSKREEILTKYRNLIDEEKSNGKKITAILKSFGNVEDIATKEKEELKKVSTFSKIKEFLIKDRTPKKKEKKEKPKKEKKENSKSFKETINRLLDKTKKFFSKFKKKKTIKEEIIEEVEELKEELDEEFEEVINITSDRKIFESKDNRILRIVFKLFGVLVLIVLLFLLLCVSTLFVASLFAILDGLKFYGISVAFFGALLLNLWIVILLNKIIFQKKINGKLFFASIILIVIITSIGIAHTVNELANIKTIKDVSDKYTMTRNFETYSLPSDKTQKYYVTFNSNYQTKYVIEYDKKLKDKITVEVKYYECYYDFYAKRGTNNLYISLADDYRDRLSVYIDDLRESKVYDSDELSRYTVTIKMNKNDADRVVIY